MTWQDKQIKMIGNFLNRVTDEQLYNIEQEFEEV